MKKLTLMLITGAVTIMTLLTMAQSVFACSWGFGELKVPEGMIR